MQYVKDGTEQAGLNYDHENPLLYFTGVGKMVGSKRWGMSFSPVIPWSAESWLTKFLCNPTLCPEGWNLADFDKPKIGSTTFMFRCDNLLHAYVLMRTSAYVLVLLQACACTFAHAHVC